LNANLSFNERAVSLNVYQ